MSRPQLVEAQRKMLITNPPQARGRRDSLARSNGSGPRWEHPAEFYKPDCPSYPCEALPERLRKYARGLATETQTPIDLTACLGMGAAAGAVAGNVRVFVRPGWIEPINIYVMVSLEPGNRKSAAFSAACAPIEEKEREEAIALRDEIARAQSELRVKEERKLRLEKEAAKTDNPAERKTRTEEAIRLAQEIAATKVPVLPRRLAQNVTQEQLITLIAEQGGRMMVTSPEGDLFDILAGRYNSNGQAGFDVILKGHSGDSTRIDRRNRFEFVRHPALTILLTVQPGVLRSMGEQKSFRDRGLSARFLMSLPKSTMGRRQIAPPPLPHEDRIAYHKTIYALASIEPATDSNGEPIARLIYLTAEANELLKNFEREIEPQLAEDGELATIADWAGKLCGAVVRIAGIVWLADNADRLQPWPDKISAESMARAIQIGRYFLAHAKAAFIEMGADPQVENAKRLLRWIEQTRVRAFTRRDAHQAHRARFKTVDEIDPVLDLLEAHNYIRPQVQLDHETRRGRKASQMYDVNPHILDKPETVEALEATAIMDEGNRVFDDDWENTIR